MKKRTKSYNESRVPFVATYSGVKYERDHYGNKVEKVVLTDVHSEDESFKLTSCTFNNSKYFSGLHSGQTVRFFARVQYSTNSYLGNVSNLQKNKLKLKLLRPTKVK